MRNWSTNGWNPFPRRKPAPAPVKPKGVYLPYRNEEHLERLQGPMRDARKLFDAPAAILQVAINNQWRLDPEEFKVLCDAAVTGMAERFAEAQAAIAELGTEEPQS